MNFYDHYYFKKLLNASIQLARMIYSVSCETEEILVIIIIFKSILKLVNDNRKLWTLMKINIYTKCEVIRNQLGTCYQSSQ